MREEILSPLKKCVVSRNRMCYVSGLRGSPGGLRTGDEGRFWVFTVLQSQERREPRVDQKVWIAKPPLLVARVTGLLLGDNYIINGPNHMQMKWADTGEERGWLQETLPWGKSGEVWAGFVQDAKGDIEKRQWPVPPGNVLLPQSWRPPHLLSLPPTWPHHSLSLHPSVWCLLLQGEGTSAPQNGTAHCPQWFGGVTVGKDGESKFHDFKSNRKR